MSIDGGACRSRGFTLIEMVIFIVIVGIGLAGILAVLNLTARNSADPVIRKNMLTIAEGLLEEITLQPFTWCDPDDANAATATSAADCATVAEALGPEGETRNGGALAFDNVNDYYVAGGWTLSPATNIAGIAFPGYDASVMIVAEALGPAGASIVADNVLRVAVTVTHGNQSLTVEGYRTRHSPNLLP